MGYGSARLWEKNPNSLQIEKFPTKSKKILKNLNHLLTWMEFLNDPLLYFIVPKTIKMSCMMRAKKAISLAAARGVIVAPACNSGVQRLKNDGVATNTQARVIALFFYKIRIWLGIKITLTTLDRSSSMLLSYFSILHDLFNFRARVPKAFGTLAPKLKRSCNMLK